MDNMKLNKSVIIVHNLLRIMRVFCVVAAIFLVIIVIAFPSLWRVASVMIKSNGIDTVSVRELLSMEEYIIPYMYIVCAVGAVVL